jgi:phage baseplate assembly protein W
MATRSFLGRGWRFPVQPDGHGHLGLAAGEQSIEESIWLILGTAPGERVMRPDFGCGIHQLVFEANSDLLHAAVAADVRQALVRWEPRIEVGQVRVEPAADQPELLLVRVDYTVRAANTVHNLVYPFHITEGGV